MTRQPISKYSIDDHATANGNEVSGRRLWEIPAVRDLIVIVLVAFALWSLYSLRQIFIPLLIAFLLAHTSNPLITSLEQNWRWPRPLTVTLLLVLSILGFSLVLLWFGPVLMEQITGLALRLPDYVRTIARRYSINPGNLTDVVEQSLRGLQLDLQHILGQIFQTTGRALGLVTTAFNTAAYLFLSLALVLVYFFVFAWHFNNALQRLSRYIPASRKERTVQILSRMDQAIGQFFRGRIFIAIVMGILLSLGWFLTDVPYWFLLGMLTGFLNIVPYLSILSWPIVILLKYVETLSAADQNSDWLSIALWPSAVYVAVQLIEGWLLTPWIQSSQTSLSATTIIIVVFIGAALAGILGMLLAIPLAACVKILLDEIFLPRIRRWAREH
jgi:predicted PurR-regulated permease PerM